MMARADLTRTDLGLVATCLDDLNRISMYAAARKYHIDRTTILRWSRKHDESGGTWPSPDDVAAQRAYLAATAVHRQRSQRRNVLGEYRTVSAVGAVRRVQALLAMGYRLGDLAAHLGVSKSRIHQLAHYHRWQRQLIRESDQEIRAMYRALCARPAPVRSEAMLDRHRRVAWRNNWAPPLAWASDAAMDDPAASPNPAWIREVPAA